MNDAKALVDTIASKQNDMIETVNRGFDTVGKQYAGLRERIESLEAGNDRPRGGNAVTDLPYRKYHTAQGEMIEVPSHVKLADVPELKAAKQPEISLERWLGATIAGERCGDKEAVQFAREQKQLVTTTTGVLIPVEYQSQWIDLLRANSVLNAAGMRTVVMEAKTQTHSAVTADPAVSWHSEAGSINAANPTFAARTLTAQTIVARCQASVELAQDSPDFGAQLAMVMTKAIGAEIDRVGLEGSGTPPQPRGIKNTSGRSSQTSVGALTDYEELTSGIGELLQANCDLEQVSKFAIMNPRTWTAYQNLVTGISSDKTPLARPASIANTRFLVTSNIAGNAASSPQVVSTIYLGDFRDLLFGVRRESSIEVLKLDTYAGNLLLEFVGYARVDFLVTRPASFHTVEGVLA
jgi:HK97 family phage major capsid protein